MEPPTNSSHSQQPQPPPITQQGLDTVVGQCGTPTIRMQLWALRNVFIVFLIPLVLLPLPVVVNDPVRRFLYYRCQFISFFLKYQKDYVTILGLPCVMQRSSPQKTSFCIAKIESPGNFNVSCEDRVSSNNFF